MLPNVLSLGVCVCQEVGDLCSYTPGLVPGLSPAPNDDPSFLQHFDRLQFFGETVVGICPSLVLTINYLRLFD
jgi:hypothetical protein